MNLVILDRDGVINQESDDYIKSAAEWHAIPGSLQAIARLYQQGYRVVVVSNQSGLARGKFNIENLNEIHSKMHTHLNQYGGVIDAVFFCPHGPDDGCDCRKPKPGLYLEVIRRLGVSTADVIAVGDKASDLDAARAAGINSLALVKTGWGQQLVDADAVPEGAHVYADLAAMVDVLLADGRV
jgi:D-glycero-D-manno-heptose 1,7-bisphosphate phosphatase